MDLDKITLGELKALRGLLETPIVKPVAIENKRAVVVVDRGWIFAGDMSTTADGYIRLERAVHVFRWESIGFAGIITDWRSDKVDIRPVEPVELPADAVIFRVPVAMDWGIR